jgi:hypothetical protein
MQITNEEVSPGVFPQWLYDHLISEISDPLTYSKGGPSKLLVVYPNFLMMDLLLTEIYTILFRH